MGCVHTKKSTKDEDNKPYEKKEEGKKEDEEVVVEANGTVEKSADGDGEAAEADVQISVPAVDGDASKSGDGDLDAFREEALSIHNRQRALHGVPELAYRDDLNASAQKWAEHIAKLGALQHTPAGEREIDGELMGENLAYKNFGSSNQDDVDAFNPSGEDIVMMWYNESKDPGYEFGKAERQPNTGHFTQVVWKSTTHMGIGKVRVQDGDSVNVYVCGQYVPAANFEGQYVDNVMPLTS